MVENLVDVEEARKAKRRVPAEKRKRAAASCDRCKSKRIKCVQDRKDIEPSDDHPCNACVKAGTPCRVTITRKIRLYGKELEEARRTGQHRSPSEHSSENDYDQASSSPKQPTMTPLDPSAYLTLAAELRSLIARYDKYGFYVHETLSQAFGSDALADAILRESSAWLADHEFIFEMIQIYHERISASFPVMHHSSFLSCYESNRHKIDSLESLPDGLHLALAAIVATSASWKSCQPGAAPHYKLRSEEAAQLALRLVGRVISSKSFTGFQALLLWANYLHTHAHRDGAYNVIGTCVRMAFALGLNQPCAWPDISDAVRETRKVMWWTMYKLERFLCASLGRLSLLNDDFITADAPDERATDLLLFSPRHSFVAETQLFQILGGASVLYIPGREPSSSEIATHLEKAEELEKHLPDPAASAVNRTHVASSYLLRAAHNCLVLNICRPAIRKLVSPAGTNGRIGTAENELLIRLCRAFVQAALDCVSHLTKLKELDLLHQVSLAPYWAYLAAMALAVPLACEFDASSPSTNASPAQRPLERIRISRKTVQAAMRQCNLIFPEHDRLLPTHRQFAFLISEICKTIPDPEDATSVAPPAMAVQPHRLPSLSVSLTSAATSNLPSPRLSYPPLNLSNNGMPHFSPQTSSSPIFRTLSPNLNKDHPFRPQMSTTGPLQNDIMTSANWLSPLPEPAGPLTPYAGLDAWLYGGSTYEMPSFMTDPPGPFDSCGSGELPSNLVF